MAKRKTKMLFFHLQIPVHVVLGKHTSEVRLTHYFSEFQTARLTFISETT